MSNSEDEKKILNNKNSTKIKYSSNNDKYRRHQNPNRLNIKENQEDDKNISDEEMLNNFNETNSVEFNDSFNNLKNYKSKPSFSSRSSTKFHTEKTSNPRSSTKFHTNDPRSSTKFHTENTNDPRSSTKFHTENTNDPRSSTKFHTENTNDPRSSTKFHTEKTNDPRSSTKFHTEKTNDPRSSTKFHTENTNDPRSSRKFHTEKTNDPRSSRKFHTENTNDPRSSRKFHTEKTKSYVESKNSQKYEGQRDTKYQKKDVNKEGTFNNKYQKNKSTVFKVENKKRDFQINSSNEKVIDSSNPEYASSIDYFIDQNKIVNEKRMNPWKQIDLDKNDTLQFTPLGGLGEIGGNMAVLESKTTAFIIDVGMSFPDETMHGVDILVPDFSHLHKIKHKIKAIVITHGHEDHIGAVPYLYKELRFPIYGTPLALRMIENKFKEHRIKVDKNTFNYIIKRNIYSIGDFKIEWMHMTHSIIDACSIAIQTPIGTIIHTADFKIDHTPIDGQTADLHRFAHYGAKGVLALFSDSTNSHKPNFTKSEAVVGATFDTIFSLAKGRIIMSTFSSNVHRIYQAIDKAIKYERKVCIIGRSMEKNIDVTRKLRYVDIPDKYLIDSFEINKFSDEEIMVITTGSQGEAMAALSRMASGEHRHLKLKPSDTVILSSHAIPGNEASVSKLMNMILKKGVTIRYKDFENIHVSGHAAQEEQKLIIRLVQPKFFLPVHGEYNHIEKHSRTAMSCGIDKRNIILMNDGDQIEISTKSLKKVNNVKSGKTFINNQNNTVIKADIIRDRQILANAGVLNISFQLDKNSFKINENIIINSFGIVSIEDSKYFIKDINKIINDFIYESKSEDLSSFKYIQTKLGTLIKKHIFKIKKIYPMILIYIFYI